MISTLVLSGIAYFGVMVGSVVSSLLGKPYDPATILDLANTLAVVVAVAHGSDRIVRTIRQSKK